MSICDSSNKKGGKTNEILTPGSNMYPVNPYLYKVCRSICKIIYPNNVGTGFFIKLFKNGKPLLLLMTNEHVITKNMIENKQTIDVYYNNQKKKINITLDRHKRYIRRYNYINIDCTIVEIIKEDNINEDYFLLPNIDFKDYNYNQLKNKKVYIVQFPLGKEMKYSKGEITNIDKYEFTHLAGTEHGSSGSPIFLEQTTKVIGIHKAANNDEKENYGDFIFPVINILNTKKNMNEYNKIYPKKIIKQNELKIIIKLETPNGFYLFGHDFVENNNGKCKIIINGRDDFVFRR